MKIIILLCLSLTVLVMADTMEQLETAYHDYQVRIGYHQAAMDSIQPRLNLLLDRIDAEKSGTRPDEETLTELLAKALELSDRIDTHKQTLGMLNDSIASVSRKLIQLYSSRIDDIRQRMGSGADGRHLRDLEQEHLNYVLKRMQVSPLLPKLSFDPAVLERVAVDQVQTESERSIYYDFLKRAFRELQQHYDLLTELQENVLEIHKLEKKATAFLDEIEEGMFIPSANRAFAAGQYTDMHGETTYGSAGISMNQSKNLADYDHIRSVIHLNQQLNGLPDSRISLMDPETLTDEDYLKILKETRISLEQLMEHTQRKLGNEISDE